MNFEYEIADHIWRFCTDLSLIGNQESEIFRRSFAGSEPVWSCSVRALDSLPSVQGTLLKRTKEQRLYFDEQLLWLEQVNRENDEVLFVSKYSFDDRECDAELWVSDKMRPYTVRMEHLWSAVDFPYQLLKKNILTLHSAVIEVENEAVLFLGPSCTGKSTQAGLWNQFRSAKQLNGDKAGIVFSGGKVMACGLPFCGTSGICREYQLPVRAFVILSQSKENRIIPLKGIRALQELMRNCFGRGEIPGCSDRIMKLLLTVLETVPVYSLACTPDERAVFALEKCLQEE